MISRPSLRPRVRPRVPRGTLLEALVRAASTPSGALGLGVLVVLGASALLAPLIAPYDPLEQHAGSELAKPFGAFMLGTDQFGRDLLSRLIHGARVSFVVAMLAVCGGALVGVTAGLIAGYRGGLLDTLVMRTTDVLLILPGILVAIAVVAVIGRGSINVAWALAVAATPEFARLTRAAVLRERESDYVLAARSVGVRDRRIMSRHVLPNVAAPLFVVATLAFGHVILAEAGLSFLGLGTQPPDPSWGGMLAESRSYLRLAPWYGVIPGVALMTLILGAHSLADALRDASDPRRSTLR